MPSTEFYALDKSLAFKRYETLAVAAAAKFELIVQGEDGVWENPGFKNATYSCKLYNGRGQSISRIFDELWSLVDLRVAFSPHYQSQCNKTSIHADVSDPTGRVISLQNTGSRFLNVLYDLRKSREMSGFLRYENDELAQENTKLQLRIKELEARQQIHFSQNPA